MNDVLLPVLWIIVLIFVVYFYFQSTRTPLSIDSTACDIDYLGIWFGLLFLATAVCGGWGQVVGLICRNTLAESL